MIEQLHTDRMFYKKLIAIALPIALQQLVTSSLNMIDTIMIGSLGETAVASVGLANRLFFLLTLILFGVCGGSSIFTAQYWGKKDVKNVRKILGLCLILGLGVSIVFAFFALITPKQAMGVFSSSREVVLLGGQYLRIIGWSYPLTAITFAYVFSLRSINNVRLPVLISASSIVVNTVLNYVFIFGHLGMPALGVEGAALATVIARIYECVVLVTLIYKTNSVVAAKLHEMVDISKEFFVYYFKTVFPVIANEFAWALGVTMYSVAYGRMGDDVVAVITITQTIEQLAMVFFQGISNATGVILGNEIGAGNKELAYEHAKKLLKVGVICSILISVAIFFGSNRIIGLYDVSEHVQYNIKLCLNVFAIYLPFKIFNYINIVGILRSGGDTTFTFKLDAGGVWLIGVPAAFIGGLVFRLPIPQVYALVMVEEVVKLFIGLPRMKTKKWVRNLVEQVV
jgi:putative MATE family efflux protein